MKLKSSVLFFIAGSAPTVEESAAAAKLGTAKFRNASQVTLGDAVERCDGVAGCVPTSYLKFPRVDVVQVEPPPVVATNPPDFVAPAASGVVAGPADQRAAEDAGAASATAAQLKAALTQVGIPFSGNTKKADLLALFLARP